MREIDVFRAALRDPRVREAFNKLMSQDRLKGFDEAVDEEEELIIFCGTSTLIDGAEKRLCGGCGVVVMISPSTLEMLKQRGNKPYSFRCPECVQVTLEEGRKNDL